MLPELREALINQLPLQSFRNIADGDYIAARMAFGAELYLQALWSSQQALEKYLKAILLLRRIPWKEHRHSLSKPLLHLEAQFPLQLSPETRSLSGSLMTGTQTGTSRILTASRALQLMELDRAVWEVRRYCIPRDRRTTPKGTSIEVLDLKHIEDSDNHPPQAYQSPSH